MIPNRNFREIGSTKRLYDGLYRLIADLWCSPKEVSHSALREDLKTILQNVPKEKDKIMDTGLYNKWLDIAHSLEKFLEKPPLSEAEYIELFELDPQCPLYVGYHNYDEPTTCNMAATSERNEYMIEVNAIYRHFGLVFSQPEMPDFLPVMIEFLALILDKRDDPVRAKFINEYLLPYLSPMKETLKKLNSNYYYLLDALEKLLEYEQDFLNFNNQNKKNYVG